jgi:hypothetical protein
MVNDVFVRRFRKLSTVSLTIAILAPYIKLARKAYQPIFAKHSASVGELPTVMLIRVPLLHYASPACNFSRISYGKNP